VPRPESRKLKWPDQAEFLATCGQVLGEGANDVNSIPKDAAREGRLCLDLVH
jgi:hypothetical protein